MGERKMENEIKEWDGSLVEVIEVRHGYTIDDAGYRQPTYNIVAGIGLEVDSDGNQTGRIVAMASDGGNLSQFEVVHSDDLDAWLMDWDQEHIDAFRAENILQGAE